MQRDPVESEQSPLVATVVAGPAAGTTTPLAVGRHVIGRAPGCALVVRDDAVEAHHVAVDVESCGSVRLRQLAGRRPVLVDGEPVGAPIAVDLGALLTVGSSLLRLDRPLPRRPPFAAGEVPGDASRRLVLRPPRAPRIEPHATVAVPAARAEPPSPPGTASIVGGLVAGVAAIGLASLVGQPMFAVFGMMGAVVSIATWGVQRVGWSRAVRRSRATSAEREATAVAAIEAAATQLRAHHLEAVSTVARALAGVGTDAQWVRRPPHGDAFEVSLGFGEVERPITVDGPAGSPPAESLGELARQRGRLTGVPYDVRLDAHDPEIVTITGPNGAALARGIIAQLAVQTGPADWCLVAALEQPEHHGWVHRLPHAAVAGLPGVVPAGDDIALAELLEQLSVTDRRAVILTDRPGLLAERGTPLRRFLDAGRKATVIAVAGAGDPIPSVSTAVVELSATGSGRWVPRPPVGSDESPWPSGRIHIAGIDRSALDELARAMTADVDPEQSGESLHSLPDEIVLSDLPGMPAEVAAVLERWDDPDSGHRPAAPLGVGRDGAVVIDLAADGPHALVAGTTGSGKSELLRTLVVSLAAQCAPEHLQFVLVDYKGGSAFDACVELPHVCGVVTDLDGGLAERAITGLRAELRRRERVLRDHGAVDLDAHPEHRADWSPARLVVVVDEFAALASEHPTFMASLVDVARRGRSLGVHLVLATQRPAGVVDDAIRANSDLRIALRLRDVADAIDVVNDAAPSRIPRRHRGRAILRCGAGELVELQVARTGDGLRGVIDVIREAHERRGGAAASPPWLPVLPAVLESVEPGSVGVVDDPAAQRQVPLRWSPDAGNLALVGARRSGTTATLVTLAAALLGGHAHHRERPTRKSVTMTDGEPRALHLYVLDARGDDRLDDVAARAECAGMVRANDRECLDRALRRLGAELDRRLSGGAGARGPDVVVMIDGLVALRAALSDRSGEPLLALLDRIVGEGPGVGLTTLAVVEPHGAAALLGRFAERWVFHLDDASHAVAVGLSPSAVPPPVAGRIVVGSSGCAAQVVVPRVIDSSRRRGTVDPRPIGRLPAVVDHVALPRGERTDDGGTWLPIGIDHTALQPFGLRLGAGEHLLVAGTPASGRTTALRRISISWREACPDGNVWNAVDVAELASSLVDVAELASSLVGAVIGAPHLVVIDDADHVTDESGDLARLIALGRPDVSVIAAIRPDLARGRFGHWTAGLARRRSGIILAAAGADADLVGVVEALRSPVDPRPGLAWVVHEGQTSLVQIATAG